MTRRKVKLAFIENESARKSTFKKRKRGILKKAQELSTLCDVKICAIIYSPSDANTEVWPSRQAVDRVVFEWKMLPEMDKTKKMMNQESFLRQRISKASDAWKKLWKENRELEMKEFMFQCLNGKTSVSRLAKSDLPDFARVIDQFLRELNHRIEILKNTDGSSSTSVSAAGGTTSHSHAMPTVEMGSSSVGFYDQIRHQIETNLNMKKNNKDLDLNKKLW